jgi:hypothetical protein
MDPDTNQSQNLTHHVLVHCSCTFSALHSLEGRNPRINSDRLPFDAAIQFSGGLLTENEFRKKSKPASCRPWTSHHFVRPRRQKDEWGVSVGYTLNIASWNQQSERRDMVFRWANDRNRILNQIQPKCCSPYASSDFGSCHGDERGSGCMQTKATIFSVTVPSSVPPLYSFQFPIGEKPTGRQRSDTVFECKIVTGSLLVGGFVSAPFLFKLALTVLLPT